MKGVTKMEEKNIASVEMDIMKASAVLEVLSGYLDATNDTAMEQATNADILTSIARDYLRKVEKALLIR